MRIGVSGHQKLGGLETIVWLRGQIVEELNAKEWYCGISCLAAGADQLFAEIVLEMAKQLETIIPCRAYETTFKSTRDRLRFRELLGRSSKSDVLDFDSPSEDAFYAAGKRVVDLSDAMLFIWNGLPSQGLGGTADIVKYARQRRRPFSWIDPTSAPMSGKL
jgi:hypothetical protein